MGSRESHAFTSENSDGDSLIFDISTVLFGSHRERIANSRFLCPVMKWPSPGGAGEGVYRGFVDLFEAIFAAHDKKTAAYDLFLRARVLDIAWMILERLDLAPAGHGQKIKQYSSNEKLNEVFRFVSENYHQELDLGSVARLCSFSPTYFAKLFKQTAGVSFCKYLNDYRIRQARVLLTETEDSVTAISDAVGFRSIQTFERVFRSALGISPSEYRRLGAGGQGCAAKPSR